MPNLPCCKISSTCVHLYWLFWILACKLFLQSDRSITNRLREKYGSVYSHVSPFSTSILSWLKTRQLAKEFLLCPCWFIAQHEIPWHIFRQCTQFKTERTNLESPGGCSDRQGVSEFAAHQGIQCWVSTLNGGILWKA